ncbi:ABC transporter permease [Methylopila sp. Yamaguchi]|uniref:ABC transporter permease n=1 Tax=Methylopila sp. Yamaguchi TaxID=1437817 RepID=UPI000CBDFEF1|nr:ABC transporter permease [Methylopila sp. Yamaguchi]GBD46806.1 nitrate/sulfonate/bicarbonate ABC transporter permease [Methylopila sp. Yamaguchi]
MTYAPSPAPANGPLALVDLPTRPKVRSAADAFVRGRRFASRALAPVLILVVWQLSSATGWVDPLVLPSPTDILAAYGELTADGELYDALQASLARSLTGLALGGFTGLLLGLFAGLWRVGEELFDAPLQMLRTVPFIAMIPLFIIWFGIGENAKIALIYAATIFPVYLNTYAGVRGVDSKLIEAGRVFDLGPTRIALRVILPTALPSILVGFRYSAGVALLALVAAEQINARSGIGYILINANVNQRTDVIVAGIILYAVLGIVIDIVMRVIERIALPWRGKLVLA